MEDSESERVFESLNLNPQLFINEVVNTLDELIDDAFGYYLQQASSTLNTDGTDRSQDLQKGVAIIRNTIQAVSDKRISLWEEYCLTHCFEVPEGFSLPKNDEPSGDRLVCQEAFNDPQVDVELDYLRNKLMTVGKESALLNQELRALEKQSVASGRYAALITEALQSHDTNSSTQVFQEMASIVSELRTKIGKMKKEKSEETKRRDSASFDYKKGFADVNPEDLQVFLAKMKQI